MLREQARRSDKTANYRLEKVRRRAVVTPFRATDPLMLRHIVIVGASGSGKTNQGLQIVAQSNPPSSLIIDVKQEYRKLKTILRRDVRVICVGDEPRLRYNPLIPLKGLDGSFWDRAFTDVFIRAYGLSEPSRRIILDSLEELREGAKVEPTLRMLEKSVAKFDAGSSKEQASRRSVESRLHNINHGAVGTSLNAGEPLDVAALDGAVVVYEIGRVDSLRDQRFLAELMLVQLWQHDRFAFKEDDEDKLKRLIVIEEAHRYLSEERPPSERGDRTLLELAIAEARRYGWGFLIIDQMPTLLSRYVWDNAGTVMMHRLANMDSYEVVRNAVGGDLLENDPLEAHEPMALQLPEDIALFRRYVDPAIGGAATGLTRVPRM
ncbi:MAG: hypothetical protein OK456_08450 [Thaumarchaeota archaeon]|nr:hypothetical protein [Nitrososphaerota archaeon]